MNITDNEYETYIRFYLDKLLTTENLEKNCNDTSIDIETNILTYILKTSNQKNYKFSSPLSATWNVTSACNFRCIHCLYNETDYFSKDDLSTQQALNLADELINTGIVFVHLTGGEIFLRSDIMDIIRKFKENNVAVTLYTNGALLTDENIAEISKLFNLYTDSVRISLDAATESTFRKIRRSDKFHIINNNIRKLVANDVCVKTVCTLNSFNKDEVYDIYTLAKSLETNFSVGTLDVFNENHSNINLSDRELFKVYYELVHDKSLDKSVMTLWKLDVLLNKPEVLKIIEEPGYQKLIKEKYSKTMLTKDCQCHDKITIQSNGRMYLCLRALNYDAAPLGSYKENSFEEIWERRWDNPLFQPRNREKSACGNCKYNTFCDGGCKINAYLNSKNVNSPAIKNCSACR